MLGSVTDAILDVKQKYVLARIALPVTLLNLIELVFNFLLIDGQKVAAIDLVLYPETEKENLHVRCG